jgi:hypothetical protein
VDDLLGAEDDQPPVDEGPITAEGVQPDWVADLRPDDMPVTIKAGNLEFEFEQARLSDMPAGLQALRDKAAALSALTEDEDTPGSGPLAGIAGSLQSSTLVAEPEPDLQISTGVRITKDQQRQVSVLEAALELTRREQAAHRLGDVEPEAEPVPAKPRRRSRFKLDRFVVSLVLLVVLVGPFISDGLHFSFVEEPQDYAFNKEQETLAQGIENLQTGEFVLVSFDYGPTVANELNPLAEAVLRDVVKQGAVPIVTSVSPLGVLNSRHVIDNLRDDEILLRTLEREEPLQPREAYIELRYIAGDAVGVRALTRNEGLTGLLFERDVDGKKTGLEFDTLADAPVAMLIVIGETLDDVRRWAEQLKDLDQLDKYLLTTSAAEPLVQAYVDADGSLAYKGYLAGYRDTYLYNRTRNAEAVQEAENLDDYNLPETDLAQWYSVALGVLAAAALVILGFVIQSLRLIGGRRS